MQEKTEPPHQRAGRQQGTVSEREKDTHLQLYCLVESVRFSLTATFILSLPCFFLVSLFVSFSYTDTQALIEIHSFNSAHSQARVRQPHISPCSAPDWEERALHGAASHRTQDPVILSSLDWGTWMLQDNLTRSRHFFGNGIAKFSFIILKSKTNRQLVKRLKWYTWVWNWSLRIFFTLSSHVPAYGFCVRLNTLRRLASCRLLV